MLYNFNEFVLVNKKPSEKIQKVIILCCHYVRSWHKANGQIDPRVSKSHPVPITPPPFHLNQQPHPVVNQSILEPSGASVLAQGADKVIDQGMGGGAEDAVTPGDDIQPRQVAAFL